MKRIAIILLIIYFSTTNVSHSAEHHSGIFYTITDSQTKEVLFHTGIKVEVGDEWLTEENKLFRVHSVDEFTAYATYLRDETLSMRSEDQVAAVANGPAAGGIIAIYHSHTDESYTPTDGKPSIRGKGSIMKVGATFKDALSSLGYNIEHDTTLHDPHDANSYVRSRRTISRLLGKQPIALFDVHRDSAPVTEYKLSSAGEQVARIVLVVGRANPYLPTTTEFAKQLKAASDAKHPKLIRGVFLANGGYNQDIHPRAILVEVGTEGSTLQEAQRGMAQFADAIPAVLGSTQNAPPAAAPTNVDSSPTPNNGTLRNILWLVGITVFGGLAYLYVSSGSWSAARSKLAQLRDIEFANLLGIKSRKKK